MMIQHQAHAVEDQERSAELSKAQMLECWLLCRCPSVLLHLPNSHYKEVINNTVK